MKRILPVVLIAIIAFILASCSKESAFSSVTEDKNTASTVKETETKTTKESIDGRYVLTKEEINTYDGTSMNLFGRTYTSEQGLVLDHNATGFELWFKGTAISANVITGGSSLYVRVFIDDDLEGVSTKIVRNRKYTFAKDLEDRVHKVRIVKATSTYGGKLTFSDIDTDGIFLSKDENTKYNIEFVGDSISCGAGVLTTSDAQNQFSNSDVTKGYAYLAASALDMNPSIVSCCGICVKGKVTLNQNMIELYPRLSFNSGGKYSFDRKQDFVVIELGTNDSWYMSSNGNYTKENFRDDYLELLNLVRNNNKDAKIICIYGLMEVNKQIEDGIKDAISLMNDEKISYLLMPKDNNGGSSHPGMDGAKKQATALVSHIEKLMNE